MSLFAGIISRKRNRPLPASVCDDIRRSISRREDTSVGIVEDKFSFLAKLDIGAFGGAGEYTDNHGNVTLAAGEPLIGDTGRADDAKAIHDALLAGDTSMLSSANGVFSAVQYRPRDGELSLITDKLGLRPIYYYISDDYVIFAGALRILEEIAEVPKIMDVRAVTEMVGLGYALADRTPYADIRMLRAAEIVRITPQTDDSERYWQWDDIQPTDLSENELLTELSNRFDNAVARRNGHDKATAAYLSGGLDSRCIVAALRQRDVSVHTFNFSRPNTQDQIFGREFAAAIGAVNQEVPKEPGDLVPDYSSLLADAWKGSCHRNGSSAERPNIAWSGEGGSVGLGHVHLTEEMVELMRAGKVEAVIKEHLRREFAQVSPRLFRSELSETMAGIIKDGIRDELDQLHSHDPARNFYIHLLINDQHRKLAKHFENIDLHRMEFQLPFFDSSFLELIVAMPIEICLRHKLYVKWLSLFPPAVASIAWQAYPGHEPCPVAVPDGLGYQWAREYQHAERSARKRQVMEQSRELLRGTDFPREVLSKTNLRLAAWAHATGLRDYGYLIGPAHTYYHYSQKCGGRHQMP